MAFREGRGTPIKGQVGVQGGSRDADKKHANLGCRQTSALVCNPVATSMPMDKACGFSRRVSVNRDACDPHHTRLSSSPPNSLYDLHLVDGSLLDTEDVLRGNSLCSSCGGGGDGSGRSFLIVRLQTHQGKRFLRFRIYGSLGLAQSPLVLVHWRENCHDFVCVLRRPVG